MKEKEIKNLNQQNSLQKNIKFITVKITNKLQNLSRCLVFPIAILPLAGLLFGVGGGLLAAANSNNWSIGLVNLFTIMKGIGQVVFSCLGILFAGSIAFGFSKKSHGVAAISGILAYMAMTVTISMIFLPYTREGIQYVTFDPWKLTGDSKMVSQGAQDGFISTVLGITPTIDLSIMGGIIVGYLTCLVHNKTWNIQLPKAFAFFSGEKFVPIASFLMGIALGIFGFFAFPLLIYMFYYIGQGLGGAMKVGSKETYTIGAGAIIAYLFGVLEQFLIPTGLNNVFYTNFWYTSAGGQWLEPIINSQGQVEGFVQLSGAYYIFFAQMTYMGQAYELTPKALQFLQDSGTSLTNLYLNLTYEADNLNMIAFNHFTTEVGTGFMSGRFAVYNWGLPAAGLAIIFTSKPENRKVVAGLIGSAMVTCFTTGIIEPLIFAFVFISPMLYGIHILIGGFSYMFCYLLNVQSGNGFTAGFIDYIFFGLFPAYSNGVNIVGSSVSSENLWGMFAGRNGALWILMFGPFLIAPAYYFGFYFAIKKFDIKTPGRENNADQATSLEAVEASLKTVNKKTANPKIIVEGLGGVNNIIEVANCASRLRVPLRDEKLVNKELLMSTGAYGININGKHIQVIYGPNVAVIAPKVKEFVEKYHENKQKEVKSGKV